MHAHVRPGPGSPQDTSLESQLILALLDREPETRLGASDGHREVLAHEWFMATPHTMDVGVTPSSTILSVAEGPQDPQSAGRQRASSAPAEMQQPFTLFD